MADIVVTDIVASVGQNGTNDAQDVRIVQALLRARGLSPGALDGVCDDQTVAAITVFQKGFLVQPDGRIDPGGRTFKRLCEPVPPPSPMPALTQLVGRPASGAINRGLRPVSNEFMTERLGSPRANFTSQCQPLTEPRLVRNLLTASVGPFRVTGLRPAVRSLEQVLAEIERQAPEVHAALGTAGMLCCRLVRGSSKSISNHSWGTAIDLTLDGILDVRGDDKVQYGLTVIAPLFEKGGWYWGAGFPTEDAMHFEASRDLVEDWAKTLQ